MKKIYPILGVFLSSIYSYANAQLLPPNLPGALKNQCNSTENCSISHHSSSPLMEVFQLSGPLNTFIGYLGYQEFLANDYWLIQYETQKGSVRNGFFGRHEPGFEDDEFIKYTEINNEPVSGNVWVLAPTTLDQFSNDFAIFTEDKNIFLSMSPEVAISGSGFYKDDPINFEPTGNMSIHLIKCIECGFDIDFNLIGINYLSDFTSEINDDDERAQLLRYRDYFEGYGTDDDIKTDIFVQAVPLPSAIWLFGSCFSWLSFLVFKKSKQPIT